jgi:8-oxoguanine deaminase
VAEGIIVVQHLERLVLMTPDDRELSDAYVVVEDGRIAEVGSGDLPETGAGTIVIDGRGLVALPGLVNTHHHFFQTLTRALPAAQDVRLLEWEAKNYPYWARLDEEAAFVTAQVAIAELLLSGCSTTADQLYAFPRHTSGPRSMMGAEIEAARGLGIRIHATRGAVDIGPESGGSRAAEFIEDTDAVLASMEDVISEYHDPAAGAMVRIGLAPNGVTVCTERLMRESAELARNRDVTLHTHIAEIPEEEVATRERYGRRPVERLADVGWLDNRVWLAHAVHLDSRDIGMLAEAGVGVAHCPGSNMRLASGMAPALEMLERGVAVGLGVDGSASNDSGNLLAEARAALLVSRLLRSDRLMTARQALRMATADGARVLSREDIGSLAVGNQADIAFFRPSGVAAAGFENDPVAGLLFASTPRCERLMVQGRFVVEDGHLVTRDEADIVERHRATVRRMVQ